MNTTRQWSNAFSSCVRRLAGRISSRRLSSVLTVVLPAIAVLLAVPSSAQQPPAIGPEMYAVPHLFALSTATTTRQFGMGGITTCIEDVGFPNPAFAGMLDRPRAGLRHSRTDFSAGLKLRGTQAWYAQEVGSGEGMQIMGFILDSNRGGTTIPGLQLDTKETDFAIHYGRRISDQWLLGVGLAPVLTTTTRLYDPAGNQIARWDSKATYGLRFGALYQFQPEGLAGLVFDYYREDVTFQPPVPGAPAQDLDFDSTTFAIGVSNRLADNLIGAIEWMQLRAEAGNLKTDTEGLSLGIEYDAAPGVLMRIGSRDGALTLGAGYTGEGWVANYAFINDWNDGDVGDLFGSSDTHQLEVGYHW